MSTRLREMHDALDEHAEEIERIPLGTVRLHFKGDDVNMDLEQRLRRRLRRTHADGPPETHPTTHPPEVASTR